MSVVGISVGSAVVPRAVQPVATYNPLTGAAVTPATAAADGSTPITGQNGTSAATAANPVPTTPGNLTAGTNRSGSATITSGGLSVAANATRKFLVGQNISAVSIGYHEFGGTAVIGTAGTYTVAAGLSFAISTTGLVNFIAASGTAAITMTEG